MHICLHPCKHRYLHACFCACMYMGLCMCVYTRACLGTLTCRPGGPGAQGQARISPASTACTGFAPGGLQAPTLGCPTPPCTYTYMHTQGQAPINGLSCRPRWWHWSRTIALSGWRWRSSSSWSCSRRWSACAVPRCRRNAPWRRGSGPTGRGCVGWRSRYSGLTGLRPSPGLQNQQDSPCPSLGSMGQDGSVNLEEEGEGEGEKGKRAECDLLGIKSMAPITGTVWWIYAGVSHGRHGFKWSLELSSFAMALLASDPCLGRPSPWVAQVASVAQELRVSQQSSIPEERDGLSLRATAKVAGMPLPDRP